MMPVTNGGRSSEKDFRIFPRSRFAQLTTPRKKFAREKWRCVVKKRTFVPKVRRQNIDVPDFIARVNQAVLPRLDALCADLTSGGKRVGHEYVALNPTRTDTSAGSFKVNLRSGRWADFATGDAGGDPVSLYAYLKGIKQLQAAKALGDKYGVAP